MFRLVDFAEAVVCLLCLNGFKKVPQTGTGRTQVGSLLIVSNCMYNANRAARVANCLLHIEDAGVDARPFFSLLLIHCSLKRSVSQSDLLAARTPEVLQTRFWGPIALFNSDSL